MANHLRARLPGRVDWPTLVHIVARDLGLPTLVRVTDAESGQLAIERRDAGLTSALHFVWPRDRPGVTELAIREGGIAPGILSAIAAVTGGRVTACEDGEEWVDVPVTRPPVELTPDGAMAAELQRMLPLTLAMPLALACLDDELRDGVETAFRRRRESGPADGGPGS